MEIIDYSHSSVVDTCRAVSDEYEESEEKIVATVSRDLVGRSGSGK